jgi:EAL domain-containing protein (putative c-di-GMP-specific phosphodiesterase class I)/GGDEF domain-containing protein
VKRPRPVLVVDNDAARRVEDVGFVAVGVASLEGLGRVIGRFGSEAAGFVLDEYVRRLESILRETDQLIRINETKYCLLLKSLRDGNHALLAGRKLEDAFAAPVYYQDTPVRLEIRAGIASGEGSHGDAELLFRAAEAARETAVTERVLWKAGDPRELGSLQRNWRLTEELADAIENHHLRLYLQPQVGCPDGSILGAEGLIRWEHRDGLLMPAQFLPHLDARGMLALTEHVIRRAVAELVADPALPRLSINLPPTQLLDPGLRQQVIEELTLWNVDPARLTLELEEDGLLDNLVDLAPGLDVLRTHGVRIVLDDCGATRSPLRRLRDLPIDGIKLARGLVEGVVDDPCDAYVCRMLIDFAHFLGMDTAAKGVESAGAIERLKEFGCDQLQGFAISPPLAADAFAEWRLLRNVTPDT